MTLFLIVKIFVIIAAILSFIGLGINSSRSGGYSFPNMVTERNTGLYICIIACAVLFFGDSYFTQKEAIFTSSIALLLILTVAFLYPYILSAIKTRKINDAIHYGIKGTYWVKDYDDHYDKIYLVRRYTYQHNFRKSSDSDNREEHWGLLDLYDNETHKYIRTISEQLLWDMIKKHKSKSFPKSYYDYVIMYPKLQYSAYCIDKDSLKEIFSQYGQEHNMTINYDFVYSVDDEYLMIYNDDIKELEKDLPQLLAKAKDF